MASLKKLLYSLLAVTVLVGYGSGLLLADSFTFATIPADGILFTPVGTTGGWGYNITNQSNSLWLVLTGTSSDTFENGTPNADVFDFPIVAPGQNVILTYDETTHTGLFEFTWNSEAPVGFTNSGTFILSGDWYTGDPFIGGELVEAAFDASVTYSVTSTEAAAPVPEPATLLLLGSGLGLVGIFKRKIIQ